MATTSAGPRRRPGRPTKAEEVRDALARVGCDPGAIDPLRVLASVAADASAAPATRVRACLALLAARDPGPAEKTEEARQARAEAAIRGRIGKKQLLERDAAEAETGLWGELLSPDRPPQH